MPKIILVASLGVAESTANLALRLSQTFAMVGEPTLLVDFGEGSHATDKLGLRMSHRPTTLEILRGEEEPGRLGMLVRSADLGLDVIPGHIHLDPEAHFGAQRLRSDLEGLEARYEDLVVVGPSTKTRLHCELISVSDAVAIRVGPGESERLQAWHETHCLTLEEKRVLLVLETSVSRKERMALSSLAAEWATPRGTVSCHVVPFTGSSPNSDGDEWPSLDHIAEPQAWAFGQIARELMHHGGT